MTEESTQSTAASGRATASRGSRSGAAADRSRRAALLKAREAAEEEVILGAATDDTLDSDPDLDLDVRKRRRRRRRRTSLRRMIVATSDLFQDIAEASADAFDAFATEVTESDDDLPWSVASGLAEGNTAYLRDIAETPRRMIDEIAPRRVRRRAVAVEIDYERLARLVADEMARRSGEG